MVPVTAIVVVPPYLPSIKGSSSSPESNPTMTRTTVLLAALAVIAIAQQPTHPPPDACQTCQFLIGQARHHFNNGVTTEPELQRELLQECAQLAQHQGQAASDQCTQIVNQNIDKIFSDLQAGDMDGQTCFDIGECTTIPTYATRPPRPSGPTNKRR